LRYGPSENLQRCPGYSQRRAQDTEAMGYQDRDYYREPSETNYVTSMVVKLIIINVVVFLADMFFSGQDHGLTKALVLRGEALGHPWMWYQFLTAGFAHDPEILWHIMGNMFGLYVFGRPLEERFGPLEFLRFYLIAILIGTVTWGVRTWFFNGGHGGLLGASGGVTATIILFCLLNPRATLLLFFAIPIPAWLFGVFLVATDLFGHNQPGSGVQVAYDVHLTGAVFALAYWYFRWNFGRLPGLAALARLFSSQPRWIKPGPSLKVHDPEEYYGSLDAEADRLLEKVNREGLSSLTDQERRILEDYSRRTRQKLR
jgi:membrane associated rhomboid family serine protease